MFRFEDHMPTYWVNESRDFQLLLRLDDILFMGQRSDIYTIQNLNDSKKCKNTFLNLLAKKVGFFTDKNIDDNVLRNIIGSFRLAIKNKGTEKGILYAVTAVLKAEKSHGNPRVEINQDDHEINIYTPVNLKNKQALKEFLKFIIPAGFLVNIYSYSQTTPLVLTPLAGSDRLISSIQANKNIGNIRRTNINEESPQVGFDNIPLSDSDREILETTQLNNYMLNTYAGSISLGIITALEDLYNITDSGITENTDSTSQSNVVISNSNLQNGIEIKEV